MQNNVISLLNRKRSFLEHRQVVEAISQHFLTSPGTADEDAVSLRLKFNAWLKDKFGAECDGNDPKSLKNRFHAALGEALTETAPSRALVVYVPHIPAKQDALEHITLTPSHGDWWRAFAVAAIVFLTTAWFVSTLAQASAHNQEIFRLDAHTRVASTNESAFQRVNDGKGLRVTSSAEAPPSGGSTGGVFLQLPSAIEQAVSGRSIEVTIEAEPLAANSAEQFAVAYSTSDVGNSGWQKFDITQEDRVFAFQYDVPRHPRGQTPSQDFLGIWADTASSGAGVMIKNVSIQIVR